MKIPYNKPYLSGNELKNIEDAIETGHISGDGFYTKACHEWFENNYGVKSALLTHSATAALEMAALLCDFDLGDEIIMPSYTFVSTANAFCLRGYVPRFVDISTKDLNIEVSKIEPLINKKTKAIVVVHYAGFPCDMVKIMDIANKHGLIVIEDAAQAFGTKLNNKYLGTFGHFGCLSFHETKNINSGEGGVLFINDTKYIERAEIIREKGTNRKNFFRGIVDKYTWVDIGSSYLPSDILSAYLLAQLDNSNYILKRRKDIYNAYYNLLHEKLTSLNIIYPRSIKNDEGNGHIFYLIFKEKKLRDDFIKEMKSLGIGCVFHYTPLHKAKFYNKIVKEKSHCPNTEFISDRIVRLPLWIGIEEHIEFISSAIIKTLKKLIVEKTN